MITIRFMIQKYLDFFGYKEHEALKRKQVSIGGPGLFTSKDRTECMRSG